MNRFRLLFHFLLTIIILALAIYVAFYFISKKKSPSHHQTKATGTPVNVVVAHKKEIPILIPSTGTVQPQYQIELTPQVSGKVEWISDKFKIGGMFKKGEVFLKLEKADYEYLLQKAKAKLAKAKLDLEIIKAKAEVAEKEWRLQNIIPKNPPPLVLLKPQILNAQAQLEAAKAEVNKAKLDLKRTVIRAPFNCIVLNEQIDKGSFIKSGQTIAQIGSTDMAEVKAALLPEQLKWVSFGSTQGLSSAKIALDPSFRIWRTGQVSRFSGHLEEKTRLAYVFIELVDPYVLAKDNHTSSLPALPFGSFVHVQIIGKPILGFPLPELALHNGNQIYVVSENNQLEIRTVDFLWQNANQIVVQKGLVEGEKVIITPLPNAAPKMKLRIVEAEPDK